MASGACGGGSLVGKSLVGSLVGKSPRQFLPHLEQEEGERALSSWELAPGVPLEHLMPDKGTRWETRARASRALFKWEG